MSGYTTFSVRYSTVTAPLYGTAGPTMSDINQGYLGDCYLLSSLAEVANQDPSAIESMITNNGNGTYGVRFYVDDQARYVTVDSQLANGGTEFNKASNILGGLIEQAYAEVQAQGVITGNGVNDGNSFSTIGNGGGPEFALEEITGASTITDFDPGRSSWTSYAYNQSFTSAATTSCCPRTPTPRIPAAAIRSSPITRCRSTVTTPRRACWRSAIRGASKPAN